MEPMIIAIYQTAMVDPPPFDFEKGTKASSVIWF